MVKSIGLFALVFALGVVAGGGATYAYLRPDAPAAPVPGSGASIPRRLDFLTMRLGLTAQQRRDVERLLTSFHQRFGARVRALFQGDDELSRARATMWEELRAILDQAQRQRLDEFVPGGPPFGGPPFGSPPFGGPPWLGHGPPGP